MLVAAGAADDTDLPQTPLRNVEMLDREGVRARLAGFHRLSGEDFFQGFVGAADVRIPYERAVEIRVLGPEHAAARMRAQFVLRSGNVVEATFDEREGEQLFAGFAPFGRVTVRFRDLQRLRLLGETTREDLPRFGQAVDGLDVRVTDREGIATELIDFGRAVGEHVLPGARGATTVDIPLRILARLEIREEKGAAVPRGVATLRNDTSVELRFPSYVADTAYRGEAEFGTYRIRLGDIRELVVRGETPVLRDLELAPAAGEDPPAEAEPQH
jgi:hypothetical protein